VSVGFGARILVGPDPELGTISGVVWDDYDENGERGSREPGIPGREVCVMWTDSLVDCIPEFDCPLIECTTTDVNGAFVFNELEAGFYTVFIVRDRCSYHTTPTELQVILVEENGDVKDFTDADFGVLPLRDCGCAIYNGTFTAGLDGWNDASYGPGVDSGVVGVVDVDGRSNVLHLDSRAGADYHLARAQLTGSCGALDHELRWDWKLGEIEGPYGSATVVLEFVDGADAPIGHYYVHRHTGDFGGAETCESLVAKDLENGRFVGCEELVGGSFEWTTTEIILSPRFFDSLQGPEPKGIAMIRVFLMSDNYDGAGAGAYFDNVAYVPVLTADR
jgi:hypothetical protein